LSPPRIGPALYCPATNEPLSSADLDTGFTAENHRAYDDLIRKLGSDHYVSPRLIKAVIERESQFNARAVSGDRAKGLMQLMPKTARSLGVTDAFNPAQNIKGGVKNLARLLNMYGGDLRLTLAAHNAGEGNVAKHGRTVPPFPETKQFVAEVLERYGCGSKVRPPDSYRDQPSLVVAGAYAPCGRR
jgi:soluble lytic murein transglycosylase-like protein